MKTAAQSAAIPAVIYARYSSHNQSEQSIEGQLHDAHAYAEREGYAIVREYIDRARSGKKDDRASFQRMIEDAQKKTFAVILVWKLDRFARNRYDSAIYKAKLKKSGVRVVSVMERIEDNPEGIILEGMLESMAEYYSANLAVNIRRGQRETIAKGKFCGGVIPYGYRLEDGHLVADERTAPIIREVFARYATGEGMKSIVTDLSSRGIRTSTGQQLTMNTFSRSLRNRVYIGEYSYNGQPVPGLAERLIDDETFLCAQDKLTVRKRAPGAMAAKVDYLLQGKAFCGHCGAPMVGECGRSKTGAVYHYYACRSKKKDHACRKTNEKKGFLEWYITEQAVAYVSDPRRAADVARSVIAEYKKEFGADIIAQHERRMAQIDAELNTLVDRLAAVPASVVPRISQRMEELADERADLEVTVSRLRVAQSIRFTEAEILAWLRQFSAGDPLDPEFQRRIIDTLVNSVYIYDDRIIIFFNIKNGKQISFLDLAQTVASGGEEFDLDCTCSTIYSQSRTRLIIVGGCVGLEIKKACE